MKTQFNFKIRSTGAVALAAAVLMAAIPAAAVTHVIQFGGSLGFAYSPTALNVAVGDTVKWQGDFGMHPLSSTSVPLGAASFNKTSGSSFSYKAAVAGTYQYQCDLHVGLGMVGSFTASATGIGRERISLQPETVRLEQNYPNPFNAVTVIRFSLPVSQKVTLKVYSVLGKEMATLVDGMVPAGAAAVSFDASALTSGVYYYRLAADQVAGVKRFILLK
jgi:plastocyanin